jgi:energy-converting hydrogenase Eha subunit E
MSQENKPNMSTPPRHYYGDIVRKLFLAAGILMLATLAIFSSLITVSLPWSVIAIIVLAFLSGLESPNHKMIVMINTIAAAIGCGFFQYTAVQYYLSTTTSMNIDWAFFAVNQILAFIFFVALYYSSKTVRAWKQIQTK